MWVCLVYEVCEGESEVWAPDHAFLFVFLFLVFVRIVLQLWHAFLAALRTFTRQRPVPVIVEEIAVEDNSDEEEKDTEDESRDEKSPPPPVLLDSCRAQDDLPEKGSRMSTPWPPPDPKALAA